MENKVIKLSSSFQKALNGLDKNSVVSWEIVRGLANVHPEYGNHIAGKLKEETGPEGLMEKLVSEWLNDLTNLFDPEMECSLRAPQNSHQSGI